MTMTSGDVLLFMTGLLTLFCPPVAMPMYASVTGHFPDSTQRQIAWRLFVWIGALMVGAVWGGQFLLRMLGLTLGALTLTGGLVLCLWSIPMMRGTNNDERQGGTVKLESLRVGFPAACGVDFVDERIHPQESQRNGIAVSLSL
ncbi:MarC family protein, partial [Paraburkholderia aspalathi]|uniref:MarC family protein n=1 Tax=Paraburkholderia aspalathi TaxID=1324617 RepID=UPI002467AF20